MSDLKSTISKVISFRDERDWKQFHNPKDLATALSIEASELLEIFLWKNGGSTKGIDEEKIREELADILIYALYIADHYQLDISNIITDKLRLNELKYPIDKSKGTSEKYDKL